MLALAKAKAERVFLALAKAKAKRGFSFNLAFQEASGKYNGK